MTNRTLPLSDDLYRYLTQVSLREPPLVARLRRETESHPRVSMQIAPEQGQFMALLVQLLQARRALEIGVFTGYSSLWVAGALPPDGRLVACDISEEYTAVARRYWAEAGLESRIDLRLAPALETLADLRAAGEEGTYDFAFLDAHKPEYIEYYEQVLPLLRPGGLVTVDNTLWSGRVADPAEQDEDTQALRAFNEHLHRDDRVDLSLVPIGDGLTLARKR